MQLTYSVALDSAAQQWPRHTHGRASLSFPVVVHPRTLSIQSPALCSSGLCLWAYFCFIDWFVPCAGCSAFIFKWILSLFSLLRCVGRCSCHGISLRRTGIMRKHVATHGRGRQVSLSYCLWACQLPNRMARNRITVFLIFILAKQIPHPFLLLGKRGLVVCSFSSLCRW